MPRLSENAVSFFGAGGHKHDGVSSTLISTPSYSLFDFNPGYIGSQSRISIQQTNQTALEEWVMNIVNTKVLAPAGLDLAPGILSGKSIRANTITAVELQANTITASELSANLVLVNNVIRSNNYNGTIAANGAITAGGNAGWAITSFGSAEFANASIRGSVIATSLTATQNGRIGPFDITASSFKSTSYNSENYMEILNYGDIAIYSAPLSGGHGGMKHQTDLVGEYIAIARLAGYGAGAPAVNRYITLGSTNGAPGNIGIEIIEDNASKFRVYQDGNVTFSGNLNGYSFTSGRHNGANQIIHTDVNGYIQAGYINSSNGDEGNNSSPAKVWGTGNSDGYLRTYLTSALSVGSAGYATSAGSAGGINTRTNITYGLTITNGNYLSDQILLIARNSTTNTGYDSIRALDTSGDTNFAVSYEGAVYANYYRYVSDRTMKENINAANVEVLRNAIDHLVPYTFQIKNTGSVSLGFIAQDVQSVLPIAVSENNNLLSLDNNALIAALVAKVQHLEQRLSALE
jgi:hypothetical protein